MKSRGEQQQQQKKPLEKRWACSFRAARFWFGFVSWKPTQDSNKNAPNIRSPATPGNISAGEQGKKTELWRQKKKERKKQIFKHEHRRKTDKDESHRSTEFLHLTFLQENTEAKAGKRKRLEAAFCSRLGFHNSGEMGSQQNASSCTYGRDSKNSCLPNAYRKNGEEAGFRVIFWGRRGAGRWQGRIKNKSVINNNIIAIQKGEMDTKPRKGSTSSRMTNYQEWITAEFSPCSNSY